MKTGRGVLATWKAVMFAPRAFFSSGPAAGDVGPLRFAATVALIVSPTSTLLGMLVDRASFGDALARALVMVFLAPILISLQIWVTAAIIHLFLRLVGGAKGPFSATLACIGYATAPAALAIVPVVGWIVGAVWQLVIIVIALRRRQNAGAATAVAAVLALPVLAVALALGLRFGVVEAFKIPSGSMSPTVVVGDHVFVNKLAYRAFGGGAPARGDVIVFRYPENKKQDFVKRIVAVGGERIETIDGRPIVNDKLAPECHVGGYLDEGNPRELYVEFLGDRAYLTEYDQLHGEPPCSGDGLCEGGLSCRAGVCGVTQGPWTVRPGELFVMGDNRNNSHDSRGWNGGRGGGVAEEDVKGRVSIVWMSFAPQGGILKERIGRELNGPPLLPGSVATSLRDAFARCLAARPAATPP